MGPAESFPGFKRVRALVLDVDGVLTDGSIILSSDGAETKRFNVRDGSAIKWLIRAGVPVAFLTGRTSEVVARRAQELGVEEVIQGAKQKLPAFHTLLAHLNVQPEEVCYVGDDLPDIPVLRCVGVACTVADAPEEVREVCHVVLKTAGGQGAARELIEMILKAHGVWDELLARYTGTG